MSALLSTRRVVSSSSSSPARSRRLLELADLKFQQIEPRRLLALVHLKRVELGLQPFPLPERRGHLLARRRPSPANSSSISEMALRIEQRLVLVLAVQLDERRRLLARAPRR